MIKTIAAKIIASYFGKFIKGVSKENLEVNLFGGTAKLSSISINSELFDNMGLPIQLAHSSIGMLDLQMSPSKLGSTPVQCLLEDVFLVFKFKERAFVDLDKGDFQKTKEIVEEYAKECLQKFKLRLDTSKQDGMFAKIGKKVIDNLQLKIHNLHIRFQEQGHQKKYAWGVTLEQIHFVTTNEKWQQSFIDRSIEANKNAILYKKMQVKNLSVYWTSQNIDFILKSQNINQKLKKEVYQNKSRIINISSDFQLKINPLNHFEASVYQLTVSLSPINISIKQVQLSQMIDFMERIVVHNELKYMFKKKAQKSQDIEQLQEVFLTYMKSYLEGYSTFNEQTAKVLQRLPIDQLLIWTINEVKTFVRSQKINELEKQKKGGWFSSSTQITKQQLSELQVLIQNAFQQQTQSLRPPSCPFYTIFLSIPSGQLNFSQSKDDKQEVLKFMYQKLALQIEKSYDDSNLKTIAKLSSIALKLFQGQSVLSIIENVTIQNQNFFQFSHQKKLVNQIQQFETSIHVQQLIGVYRYLFIKKFRQFFTFRSVDEVLKSLTLQKIQNIQTEKKQQNLVQQKNKINASIKSPLLLIPFSNTEDSQCWACNLGNLSVVSIDNSQDSDFKQYQFYNVKLEDVSLVHIPNMSACYRQQQQKDSSPLVNNINLTMLFKDRRILVDEKIFYKQIVNLTLDTFKLNFTHKQYGYLMQLIEVLRQGKKSRLEELKRQKDKLESVKVFVGRIRKQNNLLKNWTDYYAMLSGPYIYFYNDKRDLKFTESAFIKNSKVELTQNSLQIVNKYQQCVLSGERQQLQKWKTAIQDQVKRFATNVQFIDLYGQPDQKSAVNKKQYKKGHNFVFKLGVLDCHYEDKDNIVLATFRLTQLKLENISDTNEQKTVVQFKSFDISDKVFEYACQTNQTFISLRGDQFNPSIQITKYKQCEIHKGEGEKLMVALKFPILTLNWKPDVILLLIGLSKTHLDQEDILRENDYEMRLTGKKLDRFKVINDLQNIQQFKKMNQGYAKSDRLVKYQRNKYLTLEGYEELNNNKYPVLFNLSFNIGVLQCQLFHRQSHVLMFRLTGQSVIGEISFTDDQKFLSGSIQQVQLFQMFNYPKTTNSNLEFDKIQPHIILGRKGKYQKPVVQFKWSSYKEQTFFNKQRVNGFLLLIFNPVNITYAQQVIFRAIDYCLIQIIMLLTNPDQVVANEGLLEQLKKNEVVQQQQIVFAWGKFQQITKKLLAPFFFDICIQLQEPTIILMSQPNSDVYFLLNSKRLKVNNETFQTKRRFESNSNLNSDFANSIWQQNFNILAQDLYLKIIQKKQEKDLWLPVDLKMKINRLLNQDQMRHIFPQITDYDRGFKIKSSSNDIKLNLNKFEYLQVMKLLNFNITYEDERDELFIHNYKITKILIPKPIDFKLLIPTLQFTADYVVDSRIDTLFSIHFEDFEIDYKRNAQLISIISLTTPHINLETSRDGINTPILSIPDQNMRQETVKLDIKMIPDGEKTVTLYLESAKIILKLQIYQLILEWVLIQDWIFPVQSSMVHPINFMANINRAIICLQSDAVQQQKHGFVAVGSVSFKFIRKRNRIQDWYREQLSSQRMTIEQFNSKSEVSKMTLVLNIELCRCKYEDFLNTPFNSMNKRTIIFPITMNYSDLLKRTLSDTRKMLFNNTSTKTINVDKATMKIATKDIVYLNQLWSIQLKQDKQLVKALESIKQLKLQHVAVVPKQSNQMSTLVTINVQVSTISLILINNYKDAFIPLINLIIDNLSVQFIGTYKKTILNFKFQVTMNHFNSEILRWEPILEKIALTISFNNYFESKKKMFSAQTKQKIRFAINKECVQALASSANQWKNTTNDQPKPNEPVQFISHYIIVNHTGYPIDVFNAKGQLQHKIGNGEKESYDVEVADYISNDQTATVSILIKHPKLELETLKNVRLNSNIVRRMVVNSKKQFNKNFNLIIRPKYEDMKQYVYISGIYAILDNTKDVPKTTYIPIDQSMSSLRLGEPHNIELSIQRLKEKIETKFFRYELIQDKKDRMSIIKIRFKNTVTNLLPIPLSLDKGTVIMPNKSIGFDGELMLDKGIKLSSVKTYKTHMANKGQMCIFCEAYILDYYGLDIAYETAFKDPKPINPRYIAQQKLKNGSVNVTLIHTAKQKLVFKLKGKKSWSKPFVPAIGKSYFKIIEGLSEMQFSVLTKIKTINDHNKGQRLVTVIEIAPRYIIVNSSHDQLKISQADSVQSTVLKHNERQPFFWQNTKKQKYLKICAFDQSSLWGYSGPIDISMDFHCFYLRKAQDLKQYKIFMVQMQHTPHITYINITKGDSPYRLQNDLQIGSNVILFACQNEVFKSDQVLNSRQLITRIAPGQTMPLAYQFPSASKNMIIDIQFPAQSQLFYQKQCIDLQQLTEKRIKVLKNNKVIGYYLLVLEFEGNVKKIRLTQKRRIEQQQEPHLQITMKIPEISLSLIGKQDQIRKELLYFIFEQINLTIYHTNKVIQYAVSVKNTRIQNARSAKPLYPVLLQATAYPYLQFLLVKDVSNSLLIHNIGLSINKSVISLTSDEFAILHQNINDMTESITGNKNVQEAITDYDFYRRIMSERAQSFYFKKAQIHPFDCKLNFKNVGDVGGHMGKTFTNVSQASIRTDGIKLYSFSSKNISQFMTTVMDAYKQNIVSTVLPIIGNISILGNPVTLFSNIGSGFKDLVTLPAKGFEVSPLEGGKGIGRGVKSLFQKTVQGTFNSVQAIGDTIGTGLASLTFDEKFEKQRDRIRNKKSDDVLDGLINGGRSLINGIQDGFVGFVRNPLEGAQKQGIGGFFLGALKGITGLVIKPVSGIIDFTAKTAQGIKNSTQSGQATQNNRNHYPRVFYTPSRQYRAYDKNMAQVNNLITLQDPQKYSILSWCNGFLLQRTYLILTYEYMIFFNLQGYTIAKQIDARMILSCNEHQQIKKIKDRQVKQYFVLFLINKAQNQNGQLRIPVAAKEQAKAITQSVKQIILYHHNN